MVKGVNKRVIEVNNTGNKFFEKIVFYVTPEYGDLTVSQLKEATEFLSLGLNDKGNMRPPFLRKKRRLKKIRLLFITAAGVLLVSAVILKFVL